MSGKRLPPKEGEVFPAKVREITKRYVHLRLENGFMCRMDSSYLIWLTRPTVGIKLKKGTKIDVEIKVVSSSKQTRSPFIFVGHRHTDEQPWGKAQERHPIGSREQCTVIEFVPGHTIVKFESNFWAWLPDRELSWTESKKGIDTFRRRETVDLVVQWHDQEKRRILVSYRGGPAKPTPSSSEPDAQLVDIVPVPSVARDSPPVLFEGTPHIVVLTDYERNPEARVRCIAHYGTRCVVCNFDFNAVYGPRAEGVIHVHHLKQLSEIAETYIVDPIADLRPVCPNCHTVIHLGGGTLTIEQVKQMLVEAALPPS